MVVHHKSSFLRVVGVLFRIKSTHVQLGGWDPECTHNDFMGSFVKLPHLHNFHTLSQEPLYILWLEIKCFCLPRVLAFLTIGFAAGDKWREGRGREKQWEPPLLLRQQLGLREGFVFLRISDACLASDVTRAFTRFHFQVWGEKEKIQGISPILCVIGALLPTPLRRKGVLSIHIT